MAEIENVIKQILCPWLSLYITYNYGTFLSETFLVGRSSNTFFNVTTLSRTFAISRKTT